jgi:hypothetical protein
MRTPVLTRRRRVCRSWRRIWSSGAERKIMLLPGGGRFGVEWLGKEDYALAWGGDRVFRWLGGEYHDLARAKGEGERSKRGGRGREVGG